MVCAPYLPHPQQVVTESQKEQRSELDKSSTHSY